MSVTITLNDNLAAQLQAQAEARNLSVERTSDSLFQKMDIRFARAQRLLKEIVL